MRKPTFLLIIALLLLIPIGSTRARGVALAPSRTLGFIPTQGAVTSGDIYWSGEWWMVSTYGRYPASATIGLDGHLTLTVEGGEGNYCERVSAVDVINHKYAEFNGTHYTRSYPYGGTVGYNFLHAPIWVAAVPYSMYGEMDIEHACPGSCYGAWGNHRYVVWPRAEGPAEYWDDFNNLHTGYLNSNAIRLYGSAPNYSAFFSTYYIGARGCETTWCLEHWSGYTGPGVSRPSDNVHVWMSAYAFSGSSGISSRVFYGYGFAAD